MSSSSTRIAVITAILLDVIIIGWISVSKLVSEVEKKKEFETVTIDLANFFKDYSDNLSDNPDKKSKSLPTPPNTEEIEPEPEPTQAAEKILTQTQNSALSTPEVPKKKPEKQNKTITQTPIKTPPKPKPSKEVNKVLSNLFSSTPAKDKTEDQGKGGGLEGEFDDSRLAIFNNKKYWLHNRKPRKIPEPIYDCSDEGKIVVRIVVNNRGKVEQAVAGVQGSTSSSPCLQDRARRAALNTLWNADPQAPNTQEGRIIYNFKINN